MTLSAGMNYSEIQIQKILDETINGEFGTNPVILLDLWDAGGESTYIDSLRSHYEKILLDFNELFPGNKTDTRVLEISAFLGVADIALARMDFEVHTYDIPEFQENPRLKALYHKYNIHPSTGYVKDIGKNGLPYADNYFDAIILSEVIEHLNFNPFPVFQEINRILKPEGILYITSPNQAGLVNRIKMIFGRSIRNSLSDSVTQVDKTKNTICGIHWREYTLKELTELLEISGFSLEKYSYSNNIKKIYLRKRIFLPVIRFIVLLFPGLGNSITVVGKKRIFHPMTFWFHEEYIKYYPNPDR